MVGEGLCEMKYKEVVHSYKGASRCAYDAYRIFLVSRILIDPRLLLKLLLMNVRILVGQLTQHVISTSRLLCPATGKEGGGGIGIDRHPKYSRRHKRVHLGELPLLPLMLGVYLELRACLRTGYECT